MAHLAKQLQQFDEAIRLGRYSENATLAEKRARIVKRLADGIQKQRDEGAAIPKYRVFNQGSYDVGTGVKPLDDDDYDLDVGIAFETATTGLDPVDVKSWVFKAVEEHTSRVEMRRPCVTVYYKANGEVAYHVDLAVYAEPVRGVPLHLAKGKLGSAPEHRIWQLSDPERLTDRLNETYATDEQYRQAVRVVKRWRDLQFPRTGNGSPSGIGIAVAAMNWFRPRTRPTDGGPKPHLLEALRGFVITLLGEFTSARDDDGTVYSRLIVTCPTAPNDDLFARMTANHMRAFREKLETLKKALVDACDDPDPHTAALKLAAVLGSDFPVPAKEETGKPGGRAVSSSGDSG